MAIPVINSFTPVAQAPGKLVTIQGSGFTGVTSVTFGVEPALYFVVISDNLIKAYPNIDGDGTIVVTNADGTILADGFTKIVTQVRIPDLQDIGRPLNQNDLLAVWDSIAGATKRTDTSNLPAGTGNGLPGGGTGDGTTGNIYTALGSPFKVRVTDNNYEYDTDDFPGCVVISDIRLLGKKDYVVSCTDRQSEFEDWQTPAVAAAATGITQQIDGDVTATEGTNITGIGMGATWSVSTLHGAVTSIDLITPGMGYVIGDTFGFPSLPNIVFTITQVGVGIGNLEYDPINGAVIIHDYQLTPGRHITIYADGVVSDSFTNVTTQMTLFGKVLGPLLIAQGIVLPWRKAASLIPAGWQPCTSFAGKILIGQDSTDVFDANNNPLGLSQPIGTLLGAKSVVIKKANLPNMRIVPDDGSIAFKHGTAQNGGNPTTGFSSSNDRGSWDLPLGGQDKPLTILNPVVIVNWIEYIG